MATKIVANRKECANGAKIIALENIKCPQIQADNRSGLYFWNTVTISAIAAGGRAVKLFSSGDLINCGNIIAPIKCTDENTTSDMLPILPISPKASFVSLISFGASYLK